MYLLSSLTRQSVTYICSAYNILLNEECTINYEDDDVENDIIINEEYMKNAQ